MGDSVVSLGGKDAGSSCVVGAMVVDDCMEVRLVDGLKVGAEVVSTGVVGVDVVGF